MKVDFLFELSTAGCRREGSAGSSMVIGSMGYNSPTYFNGIPPGSLTGNAPEKLPKPNRKGSSSNHHFSGSMLNFGGVYWGYKYIPH